MSNTDSPNSPLSLSELVAEAWQLLRRGVEDSRHGFHSPALASLDETGRPTQRTVILRYADPSKRELICHSDARSPKIHQIRAEPRVSWLFYDGPSKVQLRLDTRARVEVNSSLARRQFETSTRSSRRCYLAPHPPSQPMGHWEPNLPEDLIGRVPDESRSQEGFANFAVIAAVVERLEYLRLAHDGHTRALFEWAEQDPAHQPPRRSVWLMA